MASGGADVVGLSGAARGLAALRMLEAGTGRRTLLAVAVDEEEADLLARDLAFFLGAGGPGGPAVVRVPADPVLPYDDLSPDRGLEMDRLAALARLHLSGAGVRAVVVSARALARRHVPRAELERNLELLGKGVAVDRDALARRLAEIGYARVPLVEDPGTFAVRGRWWTSGARSTSGRSGSSSSATRWRARGPSSRGRSARSATSTSWWWSRPGRPHSLRVGRRRRSARCASWPRRWTAPPPRCAR